MNAPKTLFSKFRVTDTFIKLEDPDITEEEFMEAVEQYLALVHSHEIKLGDLIAQYRDCFPGRHQSKLMPHLVSKHRKKKAWLTAVLSAAANFSFRERHPELNYAHYNDIQSLPSEMRDAVAAEICAEVRAGRKVTTVETRRMKRDVQRAINETGNA